MGWWRNAVAQRSQSREAGEGARRLRGPSAARRPARPDGAGATARPLAGTFLRRSRARRRRLPLPQQAQPRSQGQWPHRGRGRRGARRRQRAASEPPGHAHRAQCVATQSTCSKRGRGGLGGECGRVACAVSGPNPEAYESAPACHISYSSAVNADAHMSRRRATAANARAAGAAPTRRTWKMLMVGCDSSNSSTYPG